MHSNKVIHRDLKPSNVLISYQGQGGRHVKLCDFNISRLQGSASGGKTSKQGTHTEAIPMAYLLTCIPLVIITLWAMTTKVRW